MSNQQRNKRKTANPPHSKPDLSPSETGGKRKKILLALLGAVILAGGVYWWQSRRSDAPGESAIRGMAGSDAPKTAKNPLLQLMKPAETGVEFQNSIVETENNNILKNINIYNGGGVAIADINKDGLPDIYFIGTNGRNAMYLNEGNFKFKDITSSAGLTSDEGFETAVTVTDINADGFPDFYVCRAGPEENAIRQNRLYVNKGAAAGGLQFDERAAEYGIADGSSTTGAVFFDSDHDGDLDLYVLNTPADLSFASRIDVKTGSDGQPIPNLEPKKPMDSDRFYRNDQGHFQDVSKESGIWNFAYGLSVSVSDFNRDGFPDVYVANDFIQPDRLYINNKKGGFTDRYPEFFKHSSLSSMGSEISDFDNDGLVDVFVLDMMPATHQRQKTLQFSNAQSKYLSMVKNRYFEPVTRNVLQRNNGNGTFSDIACMAGVFQTEWSWSGLMADWDNDGLKDLHVTNGYRREITHRDFMDFHIQQIMNETKQKGGDANAGIRQILQDVPTYKNNNFIFKNAADWAFQDKSGEWMSLEPSWSCGSAWADLDADGDLDLVVNNLESPAFIYKNLCREQNIGNYLQIQLEGSPANPLAIGASVQIQTANGIQYQELYGNRGIFSSVQHLIHFGLGPLSTVESVKVRWPDGKTQTLQQVPANQRLTLRYTDASGYVAFLEPPAVQPIMSPSTAIQFQHVDNRYDDYEQFPLMPWRESDLGPIITVGDANGDGLDDAYIGNGFQQTSSLFIRQSNGSFKTASQACWETDKKYEDHGAVFFDSDQDGDQDLFVLSGGAEAVSPVAWQSRLYENTDGQGNFQASKKQSLPSLTNVGLRVMAIDLEGDGDQDLVFGGRVTPGKWPLSPPPTILRNDGARFTDATNEVAGDMAKCGMVTDIAQADLDGNGRKEIIVCGEWTPIRVYVFEGGKLVEKTEQFGFSNSNGLWNRIVVADLDGDGDQDIISGNAGLNTRFHASESAPMRCYAQDFDKNNALDPIVTLSENGQDFPWPQKEPMHRQLPVLKKKFLYAEDYAKASIADLFAGELLKEALVLQVNMLETCWWRNDGGKFSKVSLPRQAQAAPVLGIVVAEFTGDGLNDILMGGNKYGMEVEAGRSDAGTGVLLAGNGKGEFAWVDNRKSGFYADLDLRDLALLRSANGDRQVLVANNNNKVQLFQVNKK